MSDADIAGQHSAWIDRARKATGASLDENEIRQVLDLARRIAHENARPLAPLAAYALGTAVGRGMNPEDIIDRLLEPDRPTP